MFRSLALAAVLGAVAVPAFADSVTVNVAGLDAKAAHVKIVRAAQDVCNTVLQDDAVSHYYGMGPCVDEAVAAAEAKFAAADHHFASVQNTGR